MVAHAGDGNTHPTIVFDPTDEAARKRAALAFTEIMALAISLGGTITGEHGIGRLKKELLPTQLGERVMGLHHQIKHVFDPEGILNPGAILEPAVTHGVDGCRSECGRGWMSRLRGEPGEVGDLASVGWVSGRLAVTTHSRAARRADRGKASQCRRAAGSASRAAVSSGGSIPASTVSSSVQLPDALAASMAAIPAGRQQTGGFQFGDPDLVRPRPAAARTGAG